MNKKSKQYLYSITKPLTKAGVKIVEETNDVHGKTFIVIPNDKRDYGALVGENGTHAEAIRTMMRAWSGTRTDSKLRINVMIPHPQKIKTIHVP